MRPRPGRNENQLFFIDGVDEKPIWLDMAFTKTCIGARKSMVAIFLFQWLLTAKPFENSIQFTHVETALLCALIILLELGS